MRCNRSGVTSESRGGESLTARYVVQLSVFAAETPHHRINHWNLRLGQRAGAKRHLSGNLRRSIWLASVVSAIWMPPIGMSELRKCPLHQGSHEPFGGEDGSLRRPLFGRKLRNRYREFEFTSLRQRVFSFRDSLLSALKNAHLAGIRHSKSTGEPVSSGFKREFWRFLSVRTLGGGLSL